MDTEEIESYRKKGEECFEKGNYMGAITCFKFIKDLGGLEKVLNFLKKEKEGKQITSIKAAEKEIEIVKEYNRIAKGYECLEQKNYEDAYNNFENTCLIGLLTLQNSLLNDSNYEKKDELNKRIIKTIEVHAGAS